MTVFLRYNPFLFGKILLNISGYFFLFNVAASGPHGHSVNQPALTSQSSKSAKQTSLFHPQRFTIPFVF